MRISQPKLKSPAQYFEAQLTCPDCGYTGFYSIEFKGRESGDDDVECRNCHAIMTIHWEK